MNKAHRLLVMNGFDIHTEIIKLLPDSLIIENEGKTLQVTDKGVIDITPIKIEEEVEEIEIEELVEIEEEVKEIEIEELVEIEEVEEIEIEEPIEIDPKDIKKPRGWHLKYVFVDSEGNVYHKGKIQPELKNTLSKTQ